MNTTKTKRTKVGDTTNDSNTFGPSVNDLLDIASHIIYKYHCLRDRVEEGLLELCEVDAGLNDADKMTKNVGVGVLKVCKGLIGTVASG